MWNQATLVQMLINLIIFQFDSPQIFETYNIGMNHGNVDECDQTGPIYR